MKTTISDLLAPAITVPVKAKRTYAIEAVDKTPNDNAYEALNKSLMSLDGEKDQPVQRLAFEIDPVTGQSVYASLYRPKQKGLSDIILKRLSVQASIVASITNARGNHVSAFGRPQPDRFSTGFKIKPNPKHVEKLSQEEKEELQHRIGKAEKLMLTCGKKSDGDSTKDLSFSQFLFMTTRNALIFGRVAVEAIPDGEDKFHSFRPIDAGTIYFSTAQKEAADNVRRQAQNLLARLKNESPQNFIDSKGRNVDELFGSDEYAWVQVINDIPRQFFTAKECLVHNFYPVTDIEQVGYPLTPLDTVVSDVTTFINITTHNRLFFQSGRASRGAVVLQSDDIDDIDLQHIRQQFQANINGVGNSWRTPMFKVGKDDKVDWFSIDSNARDQEFQYLSDSNARTILSGFQVSPEEISGYGHLSRGTNSQALSECFDPSSYLWTNTGLRTAESILGDEQETPLQIWTGSDWQNARLFRTGEKELVETHVNGYSIKTSPDHRFRVLSEDGELVWKKQQELCIGDLLVMNAKPVQGASELIPFFRGKRLTIEMMELLGWMTGDGSLVRPKVRCGGYLKLFYHSVRERDIWAHHAKLLSDFGFNVKQLEHLIEEEEAENIKSRYGFSSVAASRITNVVNDTEFVEWLHELGCGYSHEGKAVPPVFHVLPVEYRQAFLRGLFSADGHTPRGGAVVLTIQDGRTREQVRQMLLGLSIRTLGCDGVLRESFDQGKVFSHKLFIKDRNAFWEQIGFIQPHKIARRTPQKFARGFVPVALASKLLIPVTKSAVFAGWGKRTKDNIRGCIGLHATPRHITWKQLRLILESALGMAPSWLTDYHLEPVTDLITHQSKMSMVDVEVFDSQHAQILQGFQVHNSNNEYVLEAHRDTGIRPLLWQMQTFINDRIFPLIDAELAKICTFEFVGLDAETAEKETTRLQTDATVHMTYDQILQKVEKKPLGAKWGGTFPLNPAFQQILDRYMTVGQILESFFGVAGAGKDPRLDYRRDEYWFRQVDVLNQKQQLEQQTQMQAQQAAQGGQPGQPAPQGSDVTQDAQQSAPQQGPDQSQNAPQQTAQPQQGPNQPDLSTGIDQLAGILNKSESQLPVSKRHLLAQQRLFISHAMSALEEESKLAIKEIAGIAKKHIAPTK